MKVMLIPPTFHYNDTYPMFLSFSDFSTGFGYLTSSLKEAGHQVIGFNPNNITGYVSAQVMLKDTLTKFLKENKADLIGLGGLCTDYHFLKDAIGIIRENVKTPIVLGGNIVTHDAEFIMQTVKPDYCVIGEGEEIIVQLANREPVEKINNLGYRKDGEVIFNPSDFDYRALDARPYPDYEPFGIKTFLDDYSDATRLMYKYSRTNPRVFNIVTARSCTFNCSFCVHQRGPKYRHRSVENIIQEIKETYEKYSFNVLLINDELFAVNKDYMRDFCLALIEAKEQYGWDFDWTFQTHASAAFDKETLELAKKAGCFFFGYGLESASPPVLESMHKKTKVSQIIETIKLAEEVGIGFGGNLIFGDFAETEETIRESLEFYIKHCKGAFVFLGFVTPYPGSEIFEKCMEKGIIKDKKDYYETIDKVTYNMTNLSDLELTHRFQLLNMLERAWLLSATVATDDWEEDPGAILTPLTPFMGKVHTIRAKCPYCGEDIEYRQRFHHINSKSFLGVGCTHCNQRLRIDIVN